uniref:uncharacterized protein n=1 Tax=Pristiophorus japonicus TaxID=55135 RepID=UPI00398EFD08
MKEQPIYFQIRMMSNLEGNLQLASRREQVLEKISKQPGEGFSSYHPQSAGLVERYNGMLKNKLAKLCNDTGLKWTELLPLALMVMRSATNRTTGLSPHEIVMGRPQRLPFTAPFTAKQMDIHKMEENMLNYCIALTKCISSFHSQVKEAQVKPAEGKCHNLEPGEFVYIKIFKRKSRLQPRFEGPYQVLLATNTAIKVKERPTWIHASHCKRTPDQEEGKKEPEEQKKED